jgi:hypothetical protein
MADRDEKLTLATPEDLASALAFALRFQGGKRFRSGDEFMAHITAKHLVEYLAMSGYVVMKKPPIGGHSQLSGPRRDER